jgi:hypothetical protein
VTQITDHLAKVRMRVTNAARVAGRAADDVTIVAVSKRQPAAAIERAHRAGQRQFGESFVQEALAKMQVLDLPDIEWHFIGRVQANKTRDIARAFDWVHTVDRLKVARRLDEQRPHYAPRLNVCLQINLADEPQKGGIAAEDAADLAPCVAELPRLHLRGLMTIPPEGAGVEESTAWFARLRELQQRIVVGGVPLDTLSMGMSADFEAAIASGSTMIRVGTAIFGARET